MAERAAKNKLVIAGLDISLSNIGLAIHSYNLDTSTLSTPVVELIQTEKGANRKKVRTNSDDLDRARKLHTELHDCLEGYGVQLVCVEMPVGSQNSRAAASYGVSVGIVASIKLPLVQVLPMDVKLATGYKKKIVSKQDMIDWAVKRYPNASWLTSGGRVTLKNEHMADACAAVIAGTKYDEFKLLRAAL